MPGYKIKARDLLKYTTDELRDNLCGPIILIMDDKTEIQSNHKYILFNSRAWDFHREFPRTKLLPIHTFDKILKGRYLQANTHTKVLRNCLKSVYYTYEKLYGMDKHLGSTMRYLSKKLNDLSDDIYGDIAEYQSEYTMGLDALDFAEVIQHPKIKKIVNEAPLTPEGIKDTYKQALNIILDPDFLPNNNLTFIMRTRIIKIDQALQCVIRRGYISDINGKPFPSPLVGQYFDGLRTATDLAIDSRAASIAEIAHQNALSSSVYLARRILLICMSLQNLHYYDCGSTDYFEYRVEEGDETLLDGQYFLNESNGKLEVFEPDMVGNYIGKSLKFRSIIHCACPDPNGICSVCFGEMSKTMLPGTNIGHEVAIEQTSRFGQDKMSIKHFLISVIVNATELSKDAGRFFFINGHDINQVMIRPEAIAQKMKIIFPSDRISLPNTSKSIIGGSNLSDLFEAKDIRRLDPYRVTELNEVIVYSNDGKKESYTSARIGELKRYACLSTEALFYIKEKEVLSMDPGRNYVIDLSKWDCSKPFFYVPDRQDNLMAKVTKLSKLLESNAEEEEKRAFMMSPDTLLNQLIDLFRKDGYNLTGISIFALCYSIISLENKDYGMPKTYTDSGVGVANAIFPHRSFSAMLAYEGYKPALDDPLLYSQKPIDHGLDALVDPVRYHKALLKKGVNIHDIDLPT